MGVWVRIAVENSRCICIGIKNDTGFRVRVESSLHFTQDAEFTFNKQIRDGDLAPLK